jgi:hypothetical protein
VLAPALRLETRSLEPLQRLVEVGGDDGEVPDVWEDRILARHQMDLGPLAFDPGELLERRRRLDPLEPEQLEEADGRLDIRGRDLDSDVVEHDEEFTDMAQLRNILSATLIFMSVRESWTDERLDDLSKKVDQGFARLDADMRALNGRFDSLERTLIQIGFAFGAALLTLIAALIGTIATQI